MNVFLESDRLTLHGKIGEVLAWLAQMPGDMRLEEYIRLNLH